MKKHLFSFFKKKSQENTPADEEKGGIGMNTEFAKTVDLSESFEENFPGERPDEVTYYDIHGNEVEE